VGGLDELFFPVNFNDVDYCLKLRALGKRVVFTPHARLIHHESLSRGRDDRAGKDWRARRELSCLRARWQHALINDPFYSPGLTLSLDPYTGLALPPGSFQPRSVTVPNALDIPPGY
jgi:GT2 family glycosyltransferase